MSQMTNLIEAKPDPATVRAGLGYENQTVGDFARQFVGAYADWLTLSAKQLAAPKTIFSPDEVRGSEDTFERRRAPKRSDKEFTERGQAWAAKWSKTVLAKLR